MVYTVLAIVFAVIAVGSLAGAWLIRGKRGTLGWATAAAGVTAAAAYNNSFWVVFICGLMVFWALFASGKFMNSGWRLRAGLALYLAAFAGLSVYPTWHDEVSCSVPEGTAAADTCPLVLNAMEPAAKAEALTGWSSGTAGFKRFLLANIGYRMVRGLDLKGGLRLVYTVDVDEAIKDKRDRYYDLLRAQLAKSYGFVEGDVATVAEMQKLEAFLTIDKSRDQNNKLTLKFKDGADSKKHINDKFLVQFLRELSIVRSTDGVDIAFQIRNSIESDVREKAVTQAKETINRRIDGMGVKEASLSVRDEDIIVEIPGEDERAFQEIRDIISQTARLEFKLPDDPANFFEKFHTSTDVPEGLNWEPRNVPLGKNGSQANYVPVLTKLEGESLESALKRMKEWAAGLPVEKDHEIGFGKEYRYNPETEKTEVSGWAGYYLWSRAELTGDMVRDAQASADQRDTGMGGWFVNMTLDAKGASIFADLTEAHTKERFAIILDGKVESAPVIQERIGGGSARISMGSGGIQQQMKDAQKLELVLRSGALPAPISPSNEQRIGASLGADSIDKGMWAALVGGGMVLLLMLVAYKRAGMIANLAVTFNLFLQLAVLTMFSASLTLPGIAGLALTVGVAVDANVLINERIKEEIANGKSVRAAVTLGYEKAFSAIVDGHATTLISGLILAQFGTGPIKGFAVTLIIGMVTSLFTGVVVTRLLFELWIRGRRDVNLGIN